MRIQKHKLDDIKWRLNWDSPPYVLDRDELFDIITELEELREKCSDLESELNNLNYYKI